MSIRWMPPETLSHNKFTVKSDIYSYGVLMWEIFSYGSLPFDGYSNIGVLRLAKRVRELKNFSSSKVILVYLADTLGEFSSVR